jgi:hypothetical protein
MLRERYRMALMAGIPGLAIKKQGKANWNLFYQIYVYSATG